MATAVGAARLFSKLLRALNPKPKTLNHQPWPWLGPPALKPGQRVHVPNNWVLGGLLIGIVIQVLGKYMIIGYLDP